MRALSIRQPYAELILRGVKTVEYRSRPTRIVGERFFIYATKRRPPCTDEATKGIWSADLAMPNERLPEWMIELAEQVKLIEPGTLLPTGVIVGSATIARCVPMQASSPSSLRRSVASSLFYAWHLADIERANTLRKPSGHPQPVWFKPF